MTNKVPLFGELLVQLGFLSSEDLEASIREAVQLSLPLGRSLVLSNKVSESDVNLTVALQSMMKIWDLPLAKAKMAVPLARKEGLSIADALARLGWRTRVHNTPSPSSLGGLLVDSGLISKEQLDECQHEGYNSNLPLGRVLILKGIVSHSVLAKVLEVQRMIRDGNLTYVSGAKELRAQAGTSAGLINAKHKSGAFQKRSIRLGEFLMLAGVLTESDLMNALELGLERQLTVGSALLELGLLTESVLEVALVLQGKILGGDIELQTGVRDLRKAAGLSELPDEHEAGPEQRVVIGELLRKCGLVDESQINKAIELTARYPSLIGKMLVVAGAIDEATLLAALRCQFLIRHKAITVVDGVRALQHAANNEISLDDSLDELRINVPYKLRRDVRLPQL
ncbi:MAG: hypothetical protein K2Y39_03440 [Candidatus Obscuribacterales bacterium]|nr:hypothetical protein [Candidatus Obscuribacterales bacterium]